MSGQGQVSLSNVAQALDKLTDEERAALRASRFHSQPAPEPDRASRRRLAHPGGPLATNKAAALAKFLKRKLEGDGTATLDPDLVERAVENAKASTRYGLSVALESVRHVDSFSDAEKSEDEDESEEEEPKANRKVSKVREGIAADGSTRKKRKKKKRKLKKERKAVEAILAGRKKERKGLTSKTSKKNSKATRTSLKVKDKKISKKEKKRPRS